MMIPAMPAITVNLYAYFKFLFDCAADDRFNADNILAAMEHAGIRGPLDGVIYRCYTPEMKQVLIERVRRSSYSSLGRVIHPLDRAA